MRKDKFKKKTNEERKVELTTALQKLEDCVVDMFTSDRYKEYLRFFSQMHNYSFNNTILILSQYPQASRVASFQTWKSLHISVKKGEKAIKVLVPIPYHKEIVNVNADNPEDKEIVKIDKLYFKLGNVFDIGQTDGELPSLLNELSDNPEELTKAIPILMRCNSIPTEFEESLRGDSANGYYHVVDNRIAIKPDMPSSQTFKTLIHEKAHSILHTKDIKYSRNEAEVQAESIAYIVSNALGLDTSEYSFGYIAGWSKNKDIAELRQSLFLIEQTSKSILKWITDNTELQLVS